MLNTANDISLIGVFRFFWKTKWVISFVIIATTSIAAVIAYNLPKSYDSLSIWIPEKKESNFSGDFMSLAGLGGNSSSSADWFSEVVKSHSIVLKLDTLHVPTLSSDSLITFGEYLKLDSLSFPKYASMKDVRYNTIRGYVEKNISISGDEIIELTVSSSDPLLAQHLNQFFLNELTDFESKMHSAQTQRERKFILSQLAIFEKQLRDQENKIKAFQERNKLITSPALLLKKKRLEQEESVYNLLVSDFRRKLESAKVEESRKAGHIEILQKPTLALSPTKPKKKLIIALGFGFSLFLSIGIAMLFNWWPSIRKQLKEESP